MKYFCKHQVPFRPFSATNLGKSTFLKAKAGVKRIVTMSNVAQVVDPAAVAVITKREPTTPPPASAASKAEIASSNIKHSGEGGGRVIGDGGDGGDRKVKSCDVFIGNLSLFTDNARLKDYFRTRFGPAVEDVRIMFHPETGRSRRFGFVTFSSPQIVARVLSTPNQILDGKTLDIKNAFHKGQDDVTGGGGNEGQNKRPKVGVTAASTSGGGRRHGPGMRDGSSVIGVGKVFVGGVSQDTKEADVKNYFAQFGTVDSVVVPSDPVATGRHRGFAFIQYKSEEAVDLVCSVQFHIVKGKKVEVKKASWKGVAVQPTTAALLDQGRKAGGGVGGAGNRRLKGGDARGVGGAVPWDRHSGLGGGSSGARLLPSSAAGPRPAISATTAAVAAAAGQSLRFSPYVVPSTQAVNAAAAAASAVPSVGLQPQQLPLALGSLMGPAAVTAATPGGGGLLDFPPQQQHQPQQQDSAAAAAAAAQAAAFQALLYNPQAVAAAPFNNTQQHQLQQQQAASMVNQQYPWFNSTAMYQQPQMEHQQHQFQQQQQQQQFRPEEYHHNNNNNNRKRNK